MMNYLVQVSFFNFKKLFPHSKIVVLLIDLNEILE